MLRKVLITVASAGLLASLTATPALAQNPVTASVTVTQALTISGLSPSINLGNAVPGQVATANAAEVYTVATNDPNGYTLNLEACSDSSCDQTAAPDNQGGVFLTGAGVIPYIANQTNLVVTETGTAPQTISNWVGTSSGPTPNLIHHTTAPSSDAYSENWALDIPAVPAGNYTETFAYAATAN